MNTKIINNEAVRQKDEYSRTRCPRCLKPLSQQFIKKAYARLGGLANKRKQGKNFYREIALLGLAKRWNKPIDKMVAIHNKRLKKANH